MSPSATVCRVMVGPPARSVLQARILPKAKTETSACNALRLVRRASQAHPARTTAAASLDRDQTLLTRMETALRVPRATGAARASASCAVMAAQVMLVQLTLGNAGAALGITALSVWPAHPDHSAKAARTHLSSPAGRIATQMIEPSRSVNASVLQVGLTSLGKAVGSGQSCVQYTVLCKGCVGLWCIKGGVCVVHFTATHSKTVHTGCHAFFRCMFSRCYCVFPFTGFGGPDCLECKPGSYSQGGTRDTCVSCGVGQTSPPGAPGQDFCTCPAGQGNTGSGSCGTCPPGSYSTGPSSFADVVRQAQLPVRPAPVVVAALPGCSACPDGTTSAAGATSVDQCGEFGLTWRSYWFTRQQFGQCGPGLL
jgi:hypothetical protein